jgi:hypothetical protein
MKRRTVGDISSNLWSGATGNSHSAYEQTKESLTDFEKELYGCIDQALIKYAGNFFVVVITKKERLMPNVLRNYFFSRKSCPTPDYDQTVYQYHRLSDQLEFLWVIPARDICQEMLLEAPFVHPEEKELLTYVCDFRDGKLYQKALELNGEIAH